MEITRIPVPGYEEVYRASEPRSGLVAFIAVHDTTLGPALGGCRMWRYSKEEDAVWDVLRLSKGMTYKSAVARTGLGGGKAVIVADPKSQRTPALFQDMGRFVHTLAGRYTTAEDVGTDEEMMLHMREVTPYVSGLPRENGGSGDPSPFTSHGCFVGMKACVEEVFGSDDLSNLTVAVQGIGNVGFNLAKELRDAGASLVITDVNEEALRRAADELGADVVEPNDIYGVECDVFAPCALGAVINDYTIPKLRCKIVAGAANNQLAEDHHGEVLLANGILYAPDFVLNAGGIINVSVEFLDGGYDESVAMPKVESIHQAMKDIIETSKEQGIPTSQAAVVLAKRIIAEGPPAS